MLLDGSIPYLNGEIGVIAETKVRILQTTPEQNVIGISFIRFYRRQESCDAGASKQVSIRVDEHFVLYAPMVELVDTLVLEASDESRESSSLSWGTSLLAIHTISAVSMDAESEKVVEIVTDIGFFSYHRKPHPVFGEESILDHTTK